MSARPPACDSMEKYISGVLSGDIVACKYVKQAVQRHLDDLSRVGDESFPYYFDKAEVEGRVAFCRLCNHWKGEKAGQPFDPEDWQIFLIGVLFGWKHKEGWRRFRSAYVELARKNGKTFLAAVVGLSCLLLDGEAGAEIYTAATKKDQAKIAHTDAKKIIECSPALKGRADITRDNISVPSTNGKYEPVASDSHSLDGLNTHCGIIDEYHAHKTSELFDVIDSSTGARRQPLIFTITTAGFLLSGPCAVHRRTMCEILDPDSDIRDEESLVFICTLDEGDDWTDKSVWAKANPNYRVSVYERDMDALALAASNNPTKLNAFLTKRLNIWCGQQNRWIPMDKWDRCCVDERVGIEQWRGMRAFGGIDLSSTTDITALAWAIPDGDIVHAFVRYWVPAENARQRERDDKVPYVTWGNQGIITLTSGGAVDQDAIIKQAIADAELFDSPQLAIDRWNADHVLSELDGEGLPVYKFGQGYGSMSPAAKELERLIFDGKLRVYGDPVLRWMISNSSIAMNEAGGIKPVKDKSGDRIDGVVALCMAVAQASAHCDKPSVYESRGIIAI